MFTNVESLLGTLSRPRSSGTCLRQRNRTKSQGPKPRHEVASEHQRPCRTSLDHVREHTVQWQPLNRSRGPSTSQETYMAVTPYHWSVAPSGSSNCGLANLRSCAKASQNTRQKAVPCTGKTDASHHAEKSRSKNPPKPKAGSPPSRPSQG